MEARFKLENIEEMVATLSVTMTLGEWTRLEAQLGNLPSSRPTYRLRSIIQDVIRKSSTTFTSREQEAKQ